MPQDSGKESFTSARTSASFLSAAVNDFFSRSLQLAKGANYGNLATSLEPSHLRRQHYAAAYRWCGHVPGSGWQELVAAYARQLRRLCERHMVPAGPHEKHSPILCLRGTAR